MKDMCYYGRVKKYGLLHPLHFKLEYEGSARTSGSLKKSQLLLRIGEK